jgi:hypothetical protein
MSTDAANSSVGTGLHSLAGPHDSARAPAKELTDRMLIVGKQHLRKVLAAYGRTKTRGDRIERVGACAGVGGFAMVA